MSKILIVEDDMTINGLLWNIIEKTDTLQIVPIMVQTGLPWAYMEIITLYC